MRGVPLELYGEQFGFWVVIRPVEPYNRQTRWLCRCRCGLERPVLTNNLTRGLSQSCGCIQKKLRGCR